MLSRQANPDELTMDDILAAWSRLGVLFNVDPTLTTPDVEMTIIQTARLAAENTRLFTMTGTWLKSYGAYVAPHRLRRLVETRLSPEFRPNLGLLLEWASVPALNIVTQACGKAVDACPFADAERRSKAFENLARSRATPLSRKWGRWLSESAFTVKSNALRPADWVVANNPKLTTRAFLGSVASSILAEWPNGGIVASEAEIARRLGATRLSVSEALATLQLGGLVSRRSEGRRTEIKIRRAA